MPVRTLYMMSIGVINKREVLYYDMLGCMIIKILM